MQQAERLVQQLRDIQRSHGELWGYIVKVPLESSWCDPPIPHATAHNASEDDVSCHVWTESSQYADAMLDFGRLCPSLLDLAVHSRDSCEVSLKERIRAGTEDDDRILRWLWFVAAFATTKLPGRTPRTNRKCWGTNGHFFSADILETQRENLPEGIAVNMPPDASCWFVRVDDIIQTSIEAVEYLTSGHDEDTTSFSNRTFVNQDIRDALKVQQSRTDVSASTAERFIRSEKGEGRIVRKGKQPMRLRRDLLEELNLTDIDPS